MKLDEYMRLFSEGVKHRKKFSVEWEKSEHKYNGALFYQTSTWQSKVSGPMVYESVEKMVAKELRTMYKDRIFKIDAFVPEDWASVAKHDKLIEYQDFKVPRRREKLETLARFKYLYGNKLGKIYWDEKLNQPNYKPINPYRFVIEPYVDGLEDAQWVMEEMMVDNDTIKQLAEKNGWEIKDIADELKSPAKYEEKNPDDDGMRDRSHIIEYYSNDGQYCVILNRKQIAYEGACPYEMDTFPYFGCPCTTRVETAWGNGLMTRVLDVADVDDRLLNQQIDLARLLMNPPRFVGARAGLESGHVDIIIGNNIMVQNINEIAEMKFNGASESTKAARDVLNAIKITETGLDPYATGQSVPSNAEASGAVRIMAEKADERLGLYLDKEEDMLVRFGAMWVKLNEQFLDFGESGQIDLKVRDKNGLRKETVIKADVFSDVDIVVSPPTRIIDRGSYGQMAAQAMGTLQQSPVIDQGEMAKVYLEAIQMPNIERIIISPQEQAAKQAAMAPPASAPTGDVTMQGQAVQPGMESDPNVLSGGGANG